jgi:hypothetical protein
MNNNERYNRAAIKQFRKELEAMLGDIRDIDVKCLNKAVNIGLIDVKKNTPIGSYSNEVNFTTKEGKAVSFTTKTVKVGGFMRKSWRSAPAVKSKSGGVTKSIVNNAFYSPYVNYGHRIVNSKGETVGWVKGQFMLEKAMTKVDRALLKEFQTEVERVNREHDK